MESLSIINSFPLDELDKELKQHLNLSNSTWITIEEDMKNFPISENENNLSGFLNTIFKNFYELADASISLRLINKKEYLEKVYNTDEIIRRKISENIKKVFINEFLKTYKNELIEKKDILTKKLKGAKNETGKKFRIDSKSVEILRESNEAFYYDFKIGKYLKAIYEEYASLSKFEREQIYFRDTCSKIKEAISSQRKLKIALNSKTNVKETKTYKRSFLVSPYKIVQDSTKSYNYLVCIAEEIIEKYVTDEFGLAQKISELKDKRISTIRISKINKIDIMLSKGAHITNDQKIRIEKLLQSETAMFLTEDAIDIKIKFTKKGLESFKSQAYMRPHTYTVDESNPLVYNFKCSEVQAIFYFFKFGWDAYIVEPISLRKKFEQRYKRSYQAYLGMSHDEIFLSEKEETKE